MSLSDTLFVLLKRRRVQREVGAFSARYLSRETLMIAEVFASSISQRTAASM